MQQSTKTDLLIIGGGVLGTFHAKAALERGLSVRLCEKNLRPQGASVRNFGQVVPSGMQPKWQKFGQRSLEIYQDLQEKFDITVRAEGTVYLASDVEELQLIEELAQINKMHQYPSELLSAKACLTKYQGLRQDYCQGGLLFPQEVSIEPRQMIHRVLNYLSEQQGLLYCPNTQIHNLIEQNGAVIAQDNHGRTFSAASAILCSGGEFRLLFPQLFAQSDLELCKLQMLRTVINDGTRIPGNILTGLSIRRYEAFRECPSWTSIKAAENPDSFWKKWGIHILFRQNPDGSITLGDSHQYTNAAQADELGYDLSDRINNYMQEAAKAIFDLPDYRIAASWAGYYSQCKNQAIYQYTIDNCIHIVTGIGGKGMTASPAFAEAHIQQLYT